MAAAVLTGFAAIVRSAGGSLAVEGEIPLAGFALFTLVGALLGGLLASGLNRWSSRPRRRFAETTGSLTVLSLIPPLAWADNASSRVALVAAHLLAAVILIPALARYARHQP